MQERATTKSFPSITESDAETEANVEDDELGNVLERIGRRGWTGILSGTRSCHHAGGPLDLPEIRDQRY
ncbi:hypothetical protein HYALB_00008874 [Hymenoscyphus albidus]|uniref:Uncharacterized protein n=1 Tax=Hymenoscyphus albidus TaxID=595503 RepID=A0A9N9LT04_9HELO|nr:hypothetical protein HYALB_00008874 [Hymenoscyphus albidus]